MSFAIDLAAAHGAHLTVAVPLDLPLPLVTPWGLTPDAIEADIYPRLREDAEARAAVVRERLDREDLSWAVRIDDAQYVDPALAVARNTRYADLCVIPAPKRGADDNDVAHAYFSAALFESGRPVLVVPEGAKAPRKFERVLVGWHPTREATRALHDALGMIAAGAMLDITVVDPVDGLDGEEAGADIAAHLVRHGCRVTVHRQESSGQSVATRLLLHADHVRAQLLVAGGYGHSRMREWMLGGTTRDLLAGTRIPLLFSH
jgi:nucleotide-binding universal stress UspA family protein